MADILSNNNQEQLSIKWLLWTYARPFWKWIILLVFITLTANLLTTFQPVVLSGFMTVIVGDKTVPIQNVDLRNKNSAAQNNGSIFNLNKIGARFITLIPKSGQKTPWKTLIYLAGIYLMIAIFSSVANYLAYLVALWVQINSTRLIQQDILKHLMTLNIGFFHKQKSGELMSRITQDAIGTAKGLGPLVRGLMHGSILIIIYSSYLFSTSVWLSLGSIVLIMMQFGLTQMLKKPTRQTNRAQFDCLADFSTILQEAFTSIRVIKSFGAEKYEISKIKGGIDKVVKSIA